MFSLVPNVWCKEDTPLSACYIHPKIIILKIKQ